MNVNVLEENIFVGVCTYSVSKMCTHTLDINDTYKNKKTRRNYKLSRWTFYGEAVEFPDQTMSGMTG
jgi:hypothetical protein